MRWTRAALAQIAAGHTKAGTWTPPQPTQQAPDDEDFDPDDLIDNGPVADVEEDSKPIDEDEASEEEDDDGGG